MSTCIVFVNSIPPDVLGGGEKWMVRTAKALSERGYRIGLVARPRSKIGEQFAEFGSTILPLTFGADFYPVSILKIYRFLRRVDARYLVLNFNKDVSIAGIAGRLAGVDSIVFRNGFPLIRNTLKHRVLTPFYDTVVTNSTAVVRDYTAYGWGLETKMQVIYNGIVVDDSQTSMAESDTGGPFVIVGAGRLTQLKRFDVFIDIVARLRREFPVRGIIAGAGPEMERLRQQSAALSAEVEFVGEVPTILPLLKRAHVFLHPSSSEGMPNVVMEAMACGVPVVVTNAGGTAELVTDGETGFVCDVDDAEALCRQLRSLLSDAALRRQVGLAAQQSIRANFSFAGSVDQFARLLR